MKLRTRTRLLRRLVFASLMAALLYSVPTATTPAAAQYPYGCDCTKLYTESYAVCQNRGGLISFSCTQTYNGRTGSITCGDGSHWTNSCTN